MLDGSGVYIGHCADFASNDFSKVVLHFLPHLRFLCEEFAFTIDKYCWFSQRGLVVNANRDTNLLGGLGVIGRKTW